MKRFLLFVLFCFSFINLYAQLDREHWFAPMVDRVGTGSQVQSIYMSTNETVPFKVDIYHNNIIVSSVNISKNNPVKYSIPNSQRNRIITTSQSDLFRPVAMGFYLKGEKPFFASLRFSVLNHGEIQTSKGGAALGTEFRAVMAPITNSNGILNFMNSIMATEDNTTVTVSEFQSNVRFSDNINRTQINFTLNKGQSYIIDGRGNLPQNSTGYIGAKIISDKPVVIANGNFNGQYAGNYGSASDILMDQGVPVDKLGQEFVLMKGNGETYTNMEEALILATEDNTQIYINNGTTPVATLNTGQLYETNNFPSAYINQGSGHYNMYIKSTKNIYVYQLLAGTSSSGGTVEATGGMNYIPPLSCYLPKKIDEIGKIEENEYSANGGINSLTVPTKLNIITERGATVDVKRNGISLTLNSSNGPFNVTGNNNWVTYSIPNITGNIAVFSSSAVTAGISAGNASVGYGGYFAGFSFIPAILKSEGDCLPGVKLEITEGFDSYEWLLKSGASYIPAPGINNIYTYEPTQAGIYAVKVKQGSCPEIQTPDFRFYNCTTYTNYDYNNTCTTEEITPQFALSTQTLNPSTVKIDTPPTKGTVTIAPDGKLTYTANANAIGIDTFKFSFCGNDAIPDCETVQATIHLNQTAKYDVTLTECSTNGLATYDLTSANVTPNTNVTKTYFKDAALTDLIPVAQLSNYVSAEDFVYVKLVNTSGCPETSAIITLKSKPSPVISPELYTQTHCDEDIDGIIDGTYKIDVTTITPSVLLNPSSYTVRYYDTEQKANAGGTDNIVGIFSFSGNTSVWIRVDSPDTCPFSVKEIPLKTGNTLPITEFTGVTVCDNDLDNSENINLADYVNSFTTDSGATVKYFETLANAQNNTNEITVNQTITGNSTFYYRFTKAGFCDVIGTLNIAFKSSTPSTTLLPSVTVCEGSTTTLNAGTGYTNIVWSTGATTQTIIVGAGTYWVDLTNDSGCIYHQEITVEDTPKAQLNVADYNAIHCDEDIDGIIDGIYKVDVNTITPSVLLNASSYNVRYYDTEQKANAGGTDNIAGIFSFTGNTSVWIRVDPTEFCPFMVDKVLLNIGTKTSLINSIVPTTVCDNDLDNSENINLADYVNSFTTDSGVTVKYFETLANAQNNTNEITVNQTVSANKNFFYRFSKNGFCDIIGTLNIAFKQSTPSTTLLPSVTVCEGSTTTLNVGTGYTNIVWSTGATTQTITAGAGNYWVDLTNTSGCVYHQEVTVVDSPKPQLNVAAYVSTHCDDDFDGKINITFSTDVTPVILPNYDSSLYTIAYYSDSAYTNQLPDVWSYSANTTVYVKVTSVYCATLYGQIDFKIGNSLPLIQNTVPTTVCDNDRDNSENINLADYINSFTTDSGVTVKYFETLANAQNNTNEITANQTVSANKNFFYRFSKNGFCDVIGTLNIAFKQSTPSTTLLPSVTVCEGSTTTLNVGTGYTNIVWSTGATTQTITAGAGNYWVDLTNTSGCVYHQEVTVIDSPKPQWNIAAYDAVHCDDNFDGLIRINLSSEVTPVILTNHTLFTVRYYATLAFANAGGNNNLPNNWSYSVNTTIYVRVDSPYCPTEIKQIDFKVGNPLILISDTHTDSVCDDNFDGIKAVDLSDYVQYFTTDTGITVSYFRTLANANNNTNPITNPATVNNSGTFYLRFHKNGFCDAIGKLTITVKTPKKSDILKDQKICPDAITTLDAGTGFDSYLWSTGETTQTIDVPVGDYWVELTYNGCPYKQDVSVTAVSLPEIKSIDIQGNTITINVTGGTPPYQYSLNGGTYQSSNVFYNVPSGDNTVSVISADNCAPVNEVVVIIPSYNVITPNGDGKNDVLNYSDLLKKDEPMLNIFDRFGKSIFKGDQNNRFIWDGKSGGKTLETGTYWYILEWKEPGSATITKYNGWILLKNRE